MISTMKSKLVKKSLNEALRYRGSYWREFAEELVDYHGWSGEGDEVYKYDMNVETEEAEKTTLSKGYDDNIEYTVTDEEGNEINSGEFDAEGLGSGELDGELYYIMNESLNEYHEIGKDYNKDHNFSEELVSVIWKHIPFFGGVGEEGLLRKMYKWKIIESGLIEDAKRMKELRGDSLDDIGAYVYNQMEKRGLLDYNEDEIIESLKEGLQDSLEFNQWINTILAEITILLEDDSERSEKLLASNIEDDPFKTHDEEIEEMFMNGYDPAEVADWILDIMFKEIDNRIVRESLNEKIS